MGEAGADPPIGRMFACCLEDVGLCLFTRVRFLVCTRTASHVSGQRGETLFSLYLYLHLYLYWQFSFMNIQIPADQCIVLIRWEESLMASLPLLTNWKDFWPRSIQNEQTKKCFHQVKRCGQTTSSLSNIERSLRTKWTNGSHFLMVEQTQVGSKWRNARQNTGDVSMSN